MRVPVLLAALSIATQVSSQTAADQYFDPAAMEASRQALKSSHGAQLHSFFKAERLELQQHDGELDTVWDVQGWYGGDINKFWFKTEGEYSGEESALEEVELQALFSRAISPFWDVQLGLRWDAEPEPSRTYVVLGLQGLAPHWFELDNQLFISEKGDVFVRVEAEYDVRITQRLLLQPRLELTGAFSDDPDIGVGSGFSSAEFGFRLRYEFRRGFAPYLGVNWRRSFGATKDFDRDAGVDSQVASWVAGVRFWF
ncbi:MAG: copper resistance protein B [Pseudomonadota bacterium]